MDEVDSQPQTFKQSYFPKHFFNSRSLSLPWKGGMRSISPLLCPARLCKKKGARTCLGRRRRFGFLSAENQTFAPPSGCIGNFFAHDSDKIKGSEGHFVSLPVVRGGGTACSPAVTEGIATDSDTIFHRLHLINLIPHLRWSPFPFQGKA